MPSVWISKRKTDAGSTRYRVGYQLGGRGTRARYGGSFKTKREAKIRRDWIVGELAALRVPNLAILAVEQPKAPTLREAAEAWRTSRVDVVEQTGNMHRSSVGRIWSVARHLRNRRVDAITYEDVAALIAALVATGYKRETVRKTRDALAHTLDFVKVEPNPARHPRQATEGAQGARAAAACGARRAGRGTPASASRAAIARHRRVRPARERAGDRAGGRSRRAPQGDPRAQRSREERAV